MKRILEEKDRELSASTLTGGGLSQALRRAVSAHTFPVIRLETRENKTDLEADYRASINFLRKHFEELHRRSHRK
jgi:hypothetical protein